MSRHSKKRRAHRVEVMTRSAATMAAPPRREPAADARGGEVGGEMGFRTDLTYRALPVRAASFNQQDRSVEAVLSTDAPVAVVDWSRWEMIDEVLIPGGARFGEQVPMLDSHNRYSIKDQLGSIRGMKADANGVIGRLYFAEGVQDSEDAMRKVQQGHVRDVSVGYLVTKSTDIPAGQSGVVDGKTYTAGKRTLRISTEWTLKEGSLTPIGADANAKIRDASPPQLPPWPLRPIRIPPLPPRPRLSRGP